MSDWIKIPDTNNSFKKMEWGKVWDNGYKYFETKSKKGRPSHITALGYKGIPSLSYCYEQQPL